MSLLAPAFLAGLAALALPWWLHRLSSANPERQPFASLMFLDSTEPRRVLARKLQYLLLFFLRVAAVLLLVLAFAEPVWHRAGTVPSAAAARLHVIVMDASASMQGRGRWERAGAAARQVLTELAPSDQAELVVAGTEVTIAAKPTLDRDAVQRAIDSAQPGAGRVDYGQLMRALDGIMARADLPVVIDLVTDVQQSAMPIRFTDLAPRRPAAIRIHDVAQAATPNWAIENLSRSPVTGQLVVAVKSFAPTAAVKTVTVTLNGKRLATGTLSVPAHAVATVAFEAAGLVDGDNRVLAQLTPADGFSADDRRFAVVSRPVPTSVLIVAEGGAQARPALYVEAALQTLSGLALKSRVVTTAQLLATPLDDVGFVVVPDAGTLGTSAVAALQRYLAAGGEVLLGLGRAVNGLDQVPLAGESITRPAPLDPGTETLAVGAVDVTAFAAPDALAGFGAVAFTGHVGIAPASGDQVLIRLENGDPLLIHHAAGAGSVLVFASTLDRTWSDLPVQPVFVPFMAAVAETLLRDPGVPTRLTPGTAISLAAVGLPGGWAVGPAGRRLPALPGVAGNVNPRELGFYQLRNDSRSRLLAVNLDPRESDPTPISAAAIARWESLGTERETAGPTTLAAMATVPSDGRAWAFAPWLLALFALILWLESWVGNSHLRVHRGRAAGSPAGPRA